MATAEDFDAFYAAAAPRLAGQLYLLTGDRDEARDCVQEAFERAWLRWDAVRAMDEPEAWVRTVARRLAVSRWRRVRNAATAWGHREQLRPPPGDPPERSADRLSLVAALQRLPEAQRTALVLHYLADLDVAGVAAQTGSTVSAVKTRLSRGRQALAAQLAVPMTDERGDGGRGGRVDA